MIARGLKLFAGVGAVGFGMWASYRMRRRLRRIAGSMAFERALQEMKRLLQPRGPPMHDRHAEQQHGHGLMQQARPDRHGKQQGDDPDRRLRQSQRADRPRAAGECGPRRSERGGDRLPEKPTEACERSGGNRPTHTRECNALPEWPFKRAVSRCRSKPNSFSS